MRRIKHTFFDPAFFVMDVILFSLMVMTFVTTEPAYADNWEKITGAENLRKLISGMTVEMEVRPGVIATGRYFEDGTAKIESGGATFQRTWEVRGDDQVCYSAATETKCLTVEQNLDVPGEYRYRHVETGKMRLFRVSRTDRRVMIAESKPDGGGGLAEPSAQDIAAELADPNSAMGRLTFIFDYTTFGGDLRNAHNQEALRLSFQPGIPYPLSDTVNFFLRPLIPLILHQDVPNREGGFDSKEFELGDISFDAAVGKSFENGMVLMGGLVGTLPTATDDELGLEQWLLGPELIVATVGKWGVTGLIASHQWDVAGDDDRRSTSVSGGQYFITINLGDAWQFTSSPTWSYDHNADSDDALTLPVAAGFTKTVKIDGRAWKFGLQYWHYLQSPDTFGPDYQIRFSVTPVVALPW
jgi:hypothetical protein